MTIHIIEIANLVCGRVSGRNSSCENIREVKLECLGGSDWIIEVEFKDIRLIVGGLGSLMFNNSECGFSINRNC